MASRRTRRRPFLVVRRLFVGAVVVAIIVAGAAGAFVYREITSDLPPIEAAVQYQPPVTTQILADDGTVIGEFYSQKRYLVPLDRIPQHVRQAFIAAEDDAFYRHGGIDAIGIVRAFLNNLLAGGKVQGGSTITQQVVKSVLLSPQKSYERKLKEIILSIRLERELSKDDILLLYLNHIYLGSGAYGVAAAAREYFGKDIADVTLAEAAMLAGLPQAPSRYSPYRHWPEAKARQRYVLGRMYEVGFIDRDDARRGAQRAARARQPQGQLPGRAVLRRARAPRCSRSATAAPCSTSSACGSTRPSTCACRRPPRRRCARASRSWPSASAASAPAFATWSPRSARPTCACRRRRSKAWRRPTRRSATRRWSPPCAATARASRSARSPAIWPSPPNGDGDVPTLQLNDLIRVRVVDEDGPLRFEYDPSPTIEGALVAIDQHTGFVKAMVGGYDFERSHFNRVTQAKRQPGSAFKPLVYAAALDRNFTPASVIIDEPISYSDNGRVWAPQNFEEKFFGPTSLRTALAKSRNVVTVKLAERIGMKYLINYLPRFGLSGTLPRNLSIALGTTEVTPLELAYAFCTFANNGMRPAPVLITEITDQQGQVLEHTDPALAPAIPATTAYQITSMLRDVVERGTGKRARGLEQPTAGKTGTTNDLDDAWFVGYTPQLLAAVWIGFDNKRPIGPKETGGKVAAPIWKAFMEQALARLTAQRVPDSRGPEVREHRSRAPACAPHPAGHHAWSASVPAPSRSPAPCPAVQLVTNPRTRGTVVAGLHAQRLLRQAVSC